MINISYIAAYDPYHTIFRTLSIAAFLKGTEIPVGTMRILDYYLCFPRELFRFRASREIAGQVKLLNVIKRRFDRASPYAPPPEHKTLFAKMRPTQMAALQSLAINGILDLEALREEVVKRTIRALPEALETKVAAYAADNRDLFELLASIARVPLNGYGGVKERSGLDEYRYDNV